MKFTKMHGTGNDYVYVNCFEEKIFEPSKLSVKISDRHKGIGSDGLILICPSDKADCRMEMYNADGSRGQMCGNGIRCVAKYVYDNGIVPKTHMSVETDAGIKQLDLTIVNDKCKKVKVNMGAAELVAKKVPVISKNKIAMHDPIEVAGDSYVYTAVSMGNPHAVLFLDNNPALGKYSRNPKENEKTGLSDLKDLKIEDIGPLFENHPNFPERINTEFIKVLSDDTIEMRVWERGSGETQACGTGACAAAVAAILNDKVSRDKPITVKLLGGDLIIRWDEKQNQVYMTGPAVTVFTGEIDVTEPID
ncbi:MAG: diaminopimelate epimerase [Eubacteriales bacterium]|jgi:diaminopimelate epimerase